MSAGDVQGVPVKALTWLDVDRVYPDGSGRKLAMANGSFGLRYDIYESPQEGLHLVGPDGFAVYDLPSVDAAKAAAQQDYAARIRSALDGDALAKLIREAEARGMERAAGFCDDLAIGYARHKGVPGALADAAREIRAAAAATRKEEG